MEEAVTTAEACRLLVNSLRDVAAARDEAASYRLLAQQAIHALHDQNVELTRMRQRYHELLDERRARPAA